MGYLLDMRVGKIHAFDTRQLLMKSWSNEDANISISLLSSIRVSDDRLLDLTIKLFIGSLLACSNAILLIWGEHLFGLTTLLAYLYSLRGFGNQSSFEIGLEAFLTEEAKFLR